MRAAAVSLSCTSFPRRPPYGLQDVPFVCIKDQHEIFFTPKSRHLCYEVQRAGQSKRRSRGPLMAAKKAAEAGTTGRVSSGRYKDTVDLPQTTFSMKANSVVREPEIQRLWEQKQVMKKLYECNQGAHFTLHDGPPYANGDLHIGHALNKILKDFINRYQLLQGRKVQFIPGWDCHGLPIELKVLQSMDATSRKQMSPMELREKAAQFAMKTVEEQRRSFKRYGVWADWENPYLTLTPDYEAAQIGVFGEMVLKGHIYRGRKPVHWSPSSGTALAEAELEYPDKHISQSVYVALKVSHVDHLFPAELQPLAADLGIAIWTTTPWTMLGNAAVAASDHLTYAVVEIKHVAAQLDATGDSGKKIGSGLANSKVRYLVVAFDLVSVLEDKWRATLEVKGTFPGRVLEHSRYEHPLDGRECPVVIGGDYITTESGTGLVHTAPGHGLEDYMTGQKYGLPMLCFVDEEGNFTEETGRFSGLNVLGDGNVAVIKALDDASVLLMEEPYAHKYPYDWRTKKPTIFRATEQWFASVERFRHLALEAIKEVEWFPPQGEKRITSMTVGRCDWCISRQRVWGVPIPVFYQKDTGEALMTPETISHIQGVIAQKGSDAWWSMSIEDLLPESLRHESPKYRKGEDTMDVWFDSGSSWAAVVRNREGLRWPADMYFEGSDQHRGWFQSSLLTSIATTGQAPYKKVLTHGFVLDETGYKMSKSMGNVVDPRSVIEGDLNQKGQPGYGADVLRLWVASVDYTGDVVIGSQILKQLAGVYRKLRGTLRYLLANLHDWSADKAVSYEALPLLDKYALFQLAGLLDSIKTSFESHQFYRFFQCIQHYVVVDLSNFYLDVAKDRLYVGGTNSFTRRSCQTVLAAQLLCLVRAVAPVLPHLAEDAWQHLSFAAPGGEETVFEAGWPTIQEAWGSLPEEEVAVWPTLLRVREEVNKVLEMARDGKLIGASLDAKVELFSSDGSLQERLQLMALNAGRPDALNRFLLTSQAEVLLSPQVERADSAFSRHCSDLGLWVVVSRADGSRCERCWNYSPALGSCPLHPTLCQRCVEVVEIANHVTDHCSKM